MSASENMDTFETLYWLLNDANPGGHGEDFTIEVSMVRVLGMDAEETLDLIASRTAYVVGSNPEFEEALDELLG